MENKEDIILTGECEYTREIIKKFNKMHMYSQPKNICVSIVAMLLIIYAILAQNIDIAFRCVAGGISIIWFVEMLTLPYLWTRKIFKTSKLVVETKLRYNFLEEKINLESLKNNEKIGESIISYSDLYKVVDKKEYIYLYISSNQAYVIPKNTFNGNYNKVVSIFKEKLGNKYICKK